MKLALFSLTLISVQAFGFGRPIPDYEVITPLLTSREVTSLTEMERAGLNKGAASADLWSGSYWPQYQGSLGIRYRDPSFRTLMEKKEQWDKFKELREKLPVYTYAGKESLLSPSEKYDLLVGDSEMTLTKYAWELGEKNGGTMGNVPTWRGICDGWASAAQMMPRPVKSVTLKTATGTPITFFPEDIKALGSLLYARAQKNVIFLGKRCYSAAVGLFTGACEPTNSGALHKAIVNRIGVAKKSFNSDLSTSKEVWNYPVKSYDITYYNVFNEEESKNFRDVMELFEKKNRFKKPNKRHEQTYAIVGVKAVLKYADMRGAHLLDIDGIAQDKTLEKEFYYDLELDRNFNILGGEWTSNNGPDFIWAPNDLTYPLSDAEANGKPKTPAEIVKAAQVSSKAGQPLSIIVEKLFTLSI